MESTLNYNSYYTSYLYANFAIILNTKPNHMQINDSFGYFDLVVPLKQELCDHMWLSFVQHNDRIDILVQSITHVIV